jgi:hypothetical protein
MGGRITHLVQVNGQTSPCISAKTSGPPENCHPAEGGEVEDLEIFLVRDNRKRRLHEHTEQVLEQDEQFIYLVHRTLDDIEQDAIEDHADAEYEAYQERKLLMEGT